MSRYLPLTVEQFEAARTLLEDARKRTRPRIHNFYSVFATIVRILETDSGFRDTLPGEPPWRSCHEMYLQWTSRPLSGPSVLEQALVVCGRTRALHSLRRRLQSTHSRMRQYVQPAPAPLAATVYRGQHTPFSGFKPSLSGAQGPGIYFADRFESARPYGDYVIEATVEMANPYYFYPSDESFDASVNPELIKAVLPPTEARQVLTRLARDGYDACGNEVMDALRARGHDGIVMVCPWGEPTLPGLIGDAVVIAWDASPLAYVGTRHCSSEQDASDDHTEYEAPR